MLNKIPLPLLLLTLLGTDVAYAEPDAGWYFGFAAAGYQLDDARSTATVPSSPSTFAFVPASPGIAGGIPVVGPTPVGETIGSPEVSNFGGTQAVNENFDVSFDDGKGFSVLAGYQGYKVGRLELELQYLSSTADYNSQTTGKFSSDYKTISLKGSVYHDFMLEGRLRPYIGGGTGVVQIDSSFDKDVVPQLELGLGARLDLKSRLKLDVGYRYFYGFDPRLDYGDATIETEYSGHALQIQLLWG